MGRSVDNPKNFIVSCRIDELELEALQKRAVRSGSTISRLLRESLCRLLPEPSAPSDCRS